MHIANGVLNREINKAAGKRGSAPTAGSGVVPPILSASAPQSSLAFAYPYGASLAVQKPAFPVLSSGHLSFPLNRPVCALWQAAASRVPGMTKGRLCLIGSSYVVHDDWLDKVTSGRTLTLTPARPSLHPYPLPFLPLSLCMF